MAKVTFLSQKEEIGEYKRALFAVTRSIVRALYDQIGSEDLTDLNTAREDITFRQLAKLARLDRDKGMFGDGFEWAVHEAIVGQEPTVIEPIEAALRRASPAFKSAGTPTSLMFGYERAKYLGFLDATLTEAGDSALLLPDGQGRPFKFANWVPVAAGGWQAEPRLPERISKVWKTDLFVGSEDSDRFIATTIKSNHEQLEGGAGLRVAVVPQAPRLQPGVRRMNDLWVAVLPDPQGFMGLYNDAYRAVGRAVDKLGRHTRERYFEKPSATALEISQRLSERFATAKVTDIEDALNEDAQTDLVGIETKLLSVEPPPWLRISEKPAAVIAVKPDFNI
jgi:hypothetical protein